MKSVKLLLAAAALVAMPTLFVSCDDDPWYDDYGWGWDDDYYNNSGYYDNSNDQSQQLLAEAESLSGEWDGKMVYTNGDDAQQSTFYANMTFVRNNSNAIKGTGTGVDYTLDDRGNVGETQTLKFNWYIDDSTGDIHIKYLTQNGFAFVMDANATQHGFTLTRNDDGSGTFKGYMLGSNTKDMIYIDLNIVQNTEAKRALTRATYAKSMTFGSDLSNHTFNNVKAGLDKRR